MDPAKFQHPCTCMISGPTISGKSQFVVNIINYKMVQPMLTRIISCYSKNQPLYEKLPAGV